MTVRWAILGAVIGAIVAGVNRRALVTPSVSIKSDTCGADRRRDPTPKHTGYRMS
jgi:hypothetical protein